MFIKNIEKFLKNNRVYIVPTKNGFVFLGTTIIATLLGVIYTNNTVLIISFLLFSLFMLHMFITNFNIAGLRILKAQIADAYVKDPLKLKLTIENKSRTRYQSLNISFTLKDKTIINISLESLSDEEIQFVELPFNMQRRGLYEVEKIVIWNRFPMGLFYAWSPLKITLKFYVFPNPVGKTLNHNNVSHRENEISLEMLKKQSGEFSQHRKYQNSDALSKIDWKVFARTEKLYVKEYAQGNLKYYELILPENADLEKNLEQLSRWIRDLSESPHLWSLRLKNKLIDLGGGKEHFKISMRELSIYE